MLVAQKRMDVVTHDITNVETVGFKRDAMISQSFKEMLIERIHDPSTIAVREVGPLEPGVHIDFIKTDFTQGSFDHTGIQTDMALAGAGFFTVETPQGTRYTRAGNFFISENGYLATPDGYGVVGQSGPIFIGQGVEFSVNESGEIFSGETLIDKLSIVTFDDEDKLRKVGDNLYINYEGAAEIERGCIVKQGYLEMANADVGALMVEMLTTYRLYEMNQRMVQMADETLGKAANDIGNV